MKENDTLSAKALTLISHKLRTPLSIINGYSEAILSQAGKEKFSPFTTKALEEINKQGNRMSQLVDQLLAFNQAMTADEATLEKQDIVLKDVIKECANKAIAQEGKDRAIPPAQTTSKDSVKRGTFVEIDCSSQLILHANLGMVRACILELLTNAIKFNNKMEKIIKVQGTNHGDTISVSVRDYGVGIRPQDVTKIFEPFYQVDDYFTGQITGWGLGLAMVQQILQLHHGSVSVVSDRGLGSIFTLSFPI